VARVREAIWLASHGATAAIDISDGLVADVGHMMRASGVEGGIELDAIPVMSGVSARDAAASGEEYELAIAARGALDEHAFAAAFGVPLTCVGSVATAGPAGAGVRLRSRDGFVDPLPGYDHFSR
jgi:thiamine-monophosphate kinase